jgi:hypothetical protein
MSRRLAIILVLCFVRAAIAQVGPADDADPSMPGPTSGKIDLASYSNVIQVSPSRNSLDAALTAAKSADANHRCAILVSAGTLHAVALVLPQYVELLGGFSDDFSQHDPLKYRSILDARGDGPVLIAADNSRIDGFTITGGKQDASGGAIVCRGVSPVISNNVIVGNATIHSEALKPETLHIVGHEGGAIAVLDGANPQILNNLFANNTTDLGDAGAIIVRGASNPVISRNVFVGNQTGLKDTSVYDGKVGSRSSNGAAISTSDTCAPEISRNIFVRNQSFNTSDAGAVYIEYESAPHIYGNWFVANTTGDDGGAIYVRGLADNTAAKGNGPLIENNRFAGNRVFNPGRQFDRFDEAIFLSKLGKATIRNNLFTGQGTAVGVSNSFMTLENNLIVNNVGDGVHVDLRAEGIPLSHVTGNIIWGNSGKSFATERTISPPPVLKDNVIQGGYDGEGNRDEDPQFIDDSIRAQVLELRYDPQRFVTHLKLDSPVSQTQVAGRMVSIGSQWSVIADSNGEHVDVWGEITDSSRELRIASTFKRKGG